MLRTLLILLLAGAFLAGCGGPLSRRVDPDSDDSLGGTGPDSADARTVARKMALSLLDCPEIAQAATPPTVAIMPVRNGTSFHIDTSIFTTRIQAQLTQNCRGRVSFLARDALEQVLKERKSKRDGVFTSSGQKDLLGADFFLDGELVSIEKRRDRDESTYITYVFKLIDTESSRVAWIDTFDVKKVGKRGTVYR